MASALLQFAIGITILKVISSQYQPSVKQYIIRSPQSQQSYNQQPVLIERVSIPSGPASIASTGSIGSNLIGSTGSNIIGPTDSNFIGPIGSNLIGPFGTSGYVTSPISSSFSFGNSIYRPFSSSESFVTSAQNINGPILSNGLAPSSFISNPNIPGSLSSVSGIASGKTLTDLSGILTGLQSISDEGLSGTTTLNSASHLGSSISSSTSQTSSKGIDSTVLNNLAIALQLLILNNMLNGESAEPLNENAEPSLFEIIEPLPMKSISPLNLAQSKHTSQYEYYELNEPKQSEPKQSEPHFPNCNFLGSSGFTETQMLGLPPKSSTPTHPRCGKCLMSPYEALGNTHEPFGSSYRGFESPYSSFESPYSSFESPYSSFSSKNDDLFSVNDLF